MKFSRPGNPPINHIQAISSAKGFPGIPRAYSTSTAAHRPHLGIFVDARLILDALGTVCIPGAAEYKLVDLEGLYFDQFGV